MSEQTGDFAWSYPLRVPPVPGDLSPKLGLSYASSVVDGRTSATNNQASWVGDGWDLSPGSIERTYVPCAEDKDGGTTPPQVGDLCWRSDNAVASYDGGGGQLIHDADKQVWKTKTDDGSRVEHLTGAANGARDGEYWKITAIDGTQFFFGSQPAAQSTWTVPVYGDDVGEPCHATNNKFDDSSCVQGYRWNLDKVIDRHGNMMTYSYETESNSYSQNLKDAAVSYIRGGTLKEIQYGLRSDNSIPATGKVQFTTVSRCVPGSLCTFDNVENWPDVPLNERCEAATCKDHYSPTFWSTKRLDKITTQIRNDAGYRDVDTWTLDQQFPDPGDNEKAALWLKGITHTGVAGASPTSPAITLPPVTFEGTKLANRVEKEDGVGPLNRYRLSAIVTESGGVTSVHYADPDCTANSLPANPETNTKRCFPATWARPKYAERTDHFHKYVVAEVTQSDSIGANTERFTSYSYPDGAAWHYDTSEFTQPDKRTWDEFRGFGHVIIRSGKPNDPSGPPSYSESFFYRGMNGDTMPNNGKRVASVSDSEGGSHPDHDWLSGFKFESVTKNGEGGAIVGKSITDPSWIGPTATRGSFNSYMVHAETQRSFTALAAGGWRATRTVTKYNDVGQPIEVSDEGDVSTPADDRCARTTYVQNPALWIMTAASQVETVSVACTKTPSFPQDAISTVRMAYDTLPFKTPPTTGDATRMEQADVRPASDPVFAPGSTTKFDMYGRATEKTDPLGRTSKTAYGTSAQGGPVTQIVESDPKGFANTITLDPASGQPLKSVDVNGNISETVYDTLGRATETWLPNRDRTKERGNSRYSYQISRDKPIVVTADELAPTGNYVTSTEVFDSLYRTRQAQTPATGGGRLLADTRYDSQGRAYKTTQPYFNDSPVDGNLWVASDTEVPGLTFTEFDGAGRATAQIFKGGGIKKWQTTTTYGGDRVTTTPPQGGIPTTTITDVRGQTTELWQYTTGKPEGDHLTTAYTYGKGGSLSTVTDPGGNTWRYEYDLRGRKTKDNDPDKGASTSTYDAAGQISSTTDARGTTLAYRYDELGRKLEEHLGTLQGETLASWTYDTANWGKGQPASSTRWIGGQAYVQAVTDYDALYHPIKVKTVIPNREKGLDNTYVSYTGYNPDGSQRSVGYAPAGKLSAETYSTTFDDLGNALTSYGGLAGKGTTEYVTDTKYTRYGETQQVQLGGAGKRAWMSAYYDDSTRRLNRYIVDAELPSPMQADVNYTYNQIGDVTSIADTPLASPTGSSNDTQCFRYDDQRRLTEAWTPTTSCAAEPAASSLGGAAPYWLSYTYDAVGNRLRETNHAATGNTDRKSTYVGTKHAVQSVTTEGPTGSTLDRFTYDAAGNTDQRKLGSKQQDLTWDVEGQLASVMEAGQKTEFVYGADGNRLLRRDPTGVTLYLPGQQLHSDLYGVMQTIRYYSYGSQTVAVRTETGLSWSMPDHQGTSQYSIDAQTMQLSRRRQLPFGDPRGDHPTNFPGERGFVGGITDSSIGLTTLGARQYDPANGRFISVDPLIDFGNPQQMNGYSYSSNSPITKSDPTGLNENNDVGRCIGRWGDCGIDSTTREGSDINGHYTDQQLESKGVLRRQSRKPAAPPNKKNSIGSYTLPKGGKYKFDKLEPLAYKYIHQLQGKENGALESAWRITQALLMACMDLAAENACDGYGYRLIDDDRTAINAALSVHGKNPSMGLEAALDAAITAIGMVGVGTNRVGAGPRTPLSDEGGLGGYSRLNLSGCNSFSPSTLVLMADGTSKQISQVKVGDLVANSAPGKEGVDRNIVTAVHVTDSDKDFVDLLVVTPMGDRIITSTAHHLYWNEGASAWMEAAELKAGDMLSGPRGVTVSVRSLARYADVMRTYNLSVESIHTYYVLADAVPVLVHNDGSDDIGLGDGYTGRRDIFQTTGNQLDFEIHVYYRGTEVGLFGSQGFFNKHGKSSDVTVPENVYNRLKGKAVETMRSTGRLSPRGTQDITGDKWQMPRIGKTGC